MDLIERLIHLRLEVRAAFEQQLDVVGQQGKLFDRDAEPHFIAGDLHELAGAEAAEGIHGLTGTERPGDDALAGAGAGHAVADAATGIQGAAGQIHGLTRIQHEDGHLVPACPQSAHAIQLKSEVCTNIIGLRTTSLLQEVNSVT